MTEIMTVDKSSKHLLVSALSQLPTNPALPKFSILRIYRADGCIGTGFIIGINSNGPILLANKHIAIDCFTETFSPCFVCFHESQIDYDKRFAFYPHECGFLYSVELLGMASDSIDKPRSEIDPLTGESYSVKFDAALFVIKALCICGRPFPLPDVHSIKLKKIHTFQKKVSIIGYMDPLTDSTAPLIDSSKQNLENVQIALPAGVLSESRGEIDAYGDLIAITCPTTAGFSGSPAIYEGEDGEIYAWGIFLGGPALRNHNIYLNIANTYVKDKSAGKEIISNLSAIDFPNKEFMLAQENEALVHYMKMQYRNSIREASLSGAVSQDILNHNLVLPLRRIKKFLATNKVSYK